LLQIEYITATSRKNETIIVRCFCVAGNAPSQRTRRSSHEIFVAVTGLVDCYERKIIAAGRGYITAQFWVAEVEEFERP
jgi:transcriptional regulator of NAD metabolism